MIQYEEKTQNTKYTYINTNESTHSEMGPVRQFHINKLQAKY